MTREVHKLIRTAIKDGDIVGMTSAFGEHPDAVQMNTPFGSWLHVAASFGQLEIVRKLVQVYGLDVNARGGVADANALNRAASEGHCDIVNFLLDNGAEMDVSKSQRNPLFGAIVGNHLDVGKLLIARGIDAKIRYTTETMKNMSACDFA